ncbi:hypothetical protein HMI56_005370 [Coelomomyces lativittatus]|nr:hypothetical protein HMI56_005370 [Coelomomyces lativittatus]
MFHQFNASLWSPRRKWKEKHYLQEFKTEVNALLLSKLERLHVLFSEMYASSSYSMKS